MDISGIWSGLFAAIVIGALGRLLSSGLPAHRLPAHPHRRSRRGRRRRRDRQGRSTGASGSPSRRRRSSRPCSCCRSASGRATGSGDASHLPDRGSGGAGRGVRLSSGPRVAAGQHGLDQSTVRPRGADGLSGSVSGEADKRVFATLRSLADVVLVGAGTARSEGYRPAALPIAVVTGRLDLDLTTPLFSAAEHRTIVLTCAAAPAVQRAAAAELTDLVICGDERVDVRLAVDALHERGFQPAASPRAARRCCAPWSRPGCWTRSA